ncbi:4Fe-4S binding protein [Commensalibacter oyaizuii]
MAITTAVLCGTCTSACPNDAINLLQYRMLLNELVKR